MAQPCPLYDELLDRVKKSPGQTVDLRRVCAAINGLPDEIKAPSDGETPTPTIGIRSPSGTLRIPSKHAETIFVLILHHEFLETHGTRFRVIPYKGKVFEGGRGIMFVMNELPPVLQQIIGLYISLVSE